MSKGSILEVRCGKCQEVFFPYGQGLIAPPVDGVYECPNCKHENHIIWDEELAREVARKRLGLDKDPEIKELRSELASLRKDVEKIKARLAKLAPEMRKEIVEDIVKIVMERAKKTPSLFKPV